MKHVPLSRSMVTVLFLTIAGMGGANESHQDAESLQGTWTVESMAMMGHPFDKRAYENAKWIFDGEKLIWQNGTVEQHLTFKIDAGKEPKWMDLELQTGSDTRSSLQAVYELEGGMLKVRSNGGVGDRPDTVESKRGADSQSWVLKREDTATGAEMRPAEKKRPSRPAMPARMAAVQGKGVVKELNDALVIELSNGKKYLSREEKTSRVCRKFLGKGTLKLSFSAWDTKGSDEWDGVLFAIDTMELAE